MRLILVLIIFIFCSTKSKSQTTIQVKVVGDSIAKYEMEFCNIKVTNSVTNLSVINTITNNKGICTLTIKENGNYVIEASRVGYKSEQVAIKIIEKSNNLIPVNFILSISSTTLSEVIIDAKTPPIIIKGDTIIYNTAHFTTAGDENLEDVLKKIPDIKVLDNGDITVKGKMVNKVIINGNEVTNLGAAIITKSLSTEMIKNIEVRLKEENNAFKESLLSRNDMVILDIKLKEKLQLPFFGRAKIFNGYQNKMLFGGYANTFSLNAKRSIHFLAEYDQFGTRTISLGQLKNIDKEAYESIYDLPASFQGMKEKEEYNKEIYGFKDFSIFQPALIAFSNKIIISKTVNLTIGSYNALNKELINTVNNQFFFNNSKSISYFEDRKNNSVFSKNKIEITYNPSDKRKVEYSLLYSYLNQKENQNNLTDFSNAFYFFDNKKKHTQITQNVKFEQVINKKLSVSFASQYSIKNATYIVGLNHTDSNYKILLTDNFNNLVSNFEQNKTAQTNSFLSKIYFQYTPNSTHQFNYGVKYNWTKLESSKNAFSINNLNYNLLQNSLFTAPLNVSNATVVSPYLDYSIFAGKFSLLSSFGLSKLISVSGNKNKFENHLVDYKINVTYNQNSYDVLSILWRQNITPVSLEKQSEGFDFLNFQTIGIPNINTIVPQYEHVAQLTYSTSMLAGIGVTTDIAAIYGDTRNADKFDIINNTFIASQYNQLKANYAIISNTFTKVFDKLPLSAKLTMDYMLTNQQNIGPLNKEYNTQTKMQSYDFSFFSFFENKIFDFKLNTRYQIFHFKTELSPVINKQKIFSNELVADYSYFKNSGFLRLKVKRTEFFGKTKANYTNLFLKAHYKKNNVTFFTEVDNLLNNRNFYKRDIFPSYQLDNTILTFSRYFKIGIEVKFL